MTPQEQDMINGLIQRVQQTQLPAKDDDAEALIQQGLGRNPDALYILSQTVLVQKYALDQAQAQLTQAKADLEQARQQAKPHTSFLGSLLGTDRPASPPPPPAYAPVYSGPQPGYGQGYAVPQPGYGAPVQQGPGFLQGAMQTAAGVAAGALAFEGIESLMHGFGNHAGYGRDFNDYGGGAPREEIVNNYYGDSGRDSGDVDRTDRFANDRSDLSGDTQQFDSSDGSDQVDTGFDDSSSDSGGDFGTDDSSS